MGGFSITVDNLAGDPVRLYLLQTAEKGIAWLHLLAQGRAGHGSQVNNDNAITHLAQAITRIGSHDWPVEITPTVRQLVDGLGEATGIEFDESNPSELLGRLGTMAFFVGATLRDTANPTILKAGYKHNVIPQTAEAYVDCRFLPGHEEAMLATIRELAGDQVQVEVHHRDVSLETPFEGALVDAMVDALRTEDADAPSAALLPVRGHRQQGAEPGRHHRLRFRAAAASGRSGLRGHVPRHRRAGPARRIAFRHKGSGPLPGDLLVRTCAAPG